MQQSTPLSCCTAQQNPLSPPPPPPALSPQHICAPVPHFGAQTPNSSLQPFCGALCLLFSDIYQLLHVLEPPKRPFAKFAKICSKQLKARKICLDT